MWIILEILITLIISCIIVFIGDGKSNFWDKIFTVPFVLFFVCVPVGLILILIYSILTLFLLIFV